MPTLLKIRPSGRTCTWCCGVACLGGADNATCFFDFTCGAAYNSTQIDPWGGAGLGQTPAPVQAEHVAGHRVLRVEENAPIVPTG